MTTASPSEVDRGSLELQVEDGADRLEEAAETLYKATKRFEEAEAKWDRKRLLEIARIYHDCKNEGDRLPGEDVRTALIMEIHGESPEYLEFIAAKAENEALDKRFRALSASVNARQSVLRRLS